MSGENHSNFVAVLSNYFNTSEAGLRLLLSVLAGYPVALLHRRYFYGKNTNIQHLYFIIAGLSLGYWNYGCEIFHSCAAVIFTFLTLCLFGGSNVAVAITFIFNMAYLLIGYYYAGTDNYDINWTMPHCVLVLRLIGISFDLYDGHQPFETLSSENKKVALTTKPKFMEICGHMFFPGGFLVGPQFSMKRYQDYVAGKFGDEDDAKKPPNSTTAAFNRFALGVCYLLVFQILGKYVSDDYIITEEFRELNFLKKLFLMGLWGRFTLYKYISCWLFAEGVCILFGLTHNGKDENNVVQWNGLQNVDLVLLENATQFNHYILSFNINTNHWLGQYVYKRLRFLGNRYLSQIFALLFLAIWHGFHSGYYVCFAFEFLVIYLEKDLKSILDTNEPVKAMLQQPLISNLVQLVLHMYTFVFMGWCLIPFALLTYDRYLLAMQGVNYIGIIVFLLYPIIYSPIIKKFLLKKQVGEHLD